MERTDIRSRLTVENWDKLPESKLELIGGKLVAGNSLVGSRCLLWTILQSCGPRAALPFAPAALWHQALTKAFSTPTSLAWPGGPSSSRSGPATPTAPPASQTIGRATWRMCGRPTGASTSSWGCSRGCKRHPA